MLQVKRMEIDYYYKNLLLTCNFFNYDAQLVKIEIKNIIKKLNILPGKYVNRNDHKKLLDLRKEVNNMLDNKLLSYSCELISKKILAIISSKIYEKNINSFYRNNINDNYNLFSSVNNIELQIKILKFILEKRLSLKKNNNKLYRNIKNKDLKYIIGFSSFLYYFQLALDLIYYEMNFATIEVDDNYFINIKYNKLDYNYKYLENSYDIDKLITESLLKEYMYSFKKDMGFDINDFIEVSSCLCVDIPSKYSFKIKNNVLKIKKNELVKLIYTYNKKFLSLNTINQILSYLIIDKEKVTSIYRRESTINRIDQRPIIMENDYVLYSPALLSEVYKYFTYAILINDFPYKEDLPNINNVLEKVKRKAEKQIVIDSYNIIKRNITGPIYIEKKLHQIVPLIDNNVSEILGDYDILGMDIENKIIFNIEVKHLKLCSTIYEMYRQKYGFYHKNNYETKFGKRIDFLKDNYKVIFPGKLIKDIDSYKIVNIFLTNKYFVPIFSKRNDIIYLSYSMLKNFFEK